MTATVRQLRDALRALPSTADDLEVRVWLPGSLITLYAPNGGPPAMLVTSDVVRIEGNIVPGSVLDHGDTLGD